MTDNWDSVVNLERQEYDRGYLNGFEDAMHMSEDSSGYSNGFLKGYAIGFEAGFFEASAAAILENRKIGSTESIFTERGKRKLEGLKGKASQLPNLNDENVNFDDEIQALRSQYKQLGSSFGLCPPKLEAAKTSIPVSHEW